MAAALLSAVVLLVTGCSGDDPPQAAPPPVPPPASTSPAAVPSSPATPATPATPAAPPPPLAWTGCGASFECAALPVPLDTAEGTLDLALTRRRATGPGERVGVLLVNPGGPGSSAVDYLKRAYTGLPRPLRERFDVVAFDPRGVGASAPVRCASTAQLDAYVALDPSPDDPAEQAAYERGNAELTAGCQAQSGQVLPHVSTADAAEDMDRVRAALGEQRVSYLGYSYGTSLGAAYLDAHPDRVRAMVLDGAIDPSLTWDQVLAGQARGFDDAFRALLADCAARGCAFRDAVGGGDLGAAYDALAQRVEAAPLPVAGSTRTVGPGELSYGVGAGLYDRRSGWPAVAAALGSAVGGDGAPLLALSDAYLGRGADGYDGTIEANLAVNCIDRPWPREPGPYYALAAQVAVDAPRFGPAIALSGLTCATWPAPVVGAPHRVTAPGAPPVVVVGTTRDPATPYPWAVALADQLEQGVLVTYDGDGHTAYRGSAPACLRTPLDDYLLTGVAPRPLRC